MKPNRQENPMIGDVPLEKQFYSLGFVAVMLQQSPQFVESLMRAAGVEFDHYSNGIGQIRGDGLVAMKEKLAAINADAQARLAAAANN